MKAYKGFNRDMTCKGYQYAEGQTYETETAELCESGFHACERPVDCFDYYPPRDSVYHEVELEDVSPQRSDDTKIVGRKITIGARLTIGQLVQAQFEYCKEHATDGRTDPNQASAGENGAASAGWRGAASAGAYGAASAGWRGAASAGENGAASAGENGAASAGAFGAASAGAYGAASAGWRGAASAGWRGAASAGAYGAASAGWRGAASAGAYGAAVSRGTAQTAENGIVCARGNGCRVQGGLGSLLVIAEEGQNDFDIVAWKAVVVDGTAVKADTWYALTNGELVEVTGDDQG